MPPGCDHMRKLAHRGVHHVPAGGNVENPHGIPARTRYSRAVPVISRGRAGHMCKGQNFPGQGYPPGSGSGQNTPQPRERWQELLVVFRQDARIGSRVQGRHSPERYPRCVASRSLLRGFIFFIFLPAQNDIIRRKADLASPRQELVSFGDNIG